MVLLVTATEPIAAAFLAPALPRLAARHPGIMVELVTDIRTLDLARREADIALRLARPRLGDLSVRRLGEVGYALYAARDYVARAGMPDPTTQCRGHALIDWPLDYTVIEQVPWLRSTAAAAQVVMRSGSAIARHAACRAGVGVALLPCILAAGDPQLLRIKTAPPPAQEFWLVTHRDLARMPRVRVVLDFIAAEARRARTRLGGGVKPAA